MEIGRISGAVNQGHEMRPAAEKQPEPEAQPSDSVVIQGGGSGGKQAAKKMKVLEVDQWTSTGNISDFSMKDFDLEKLEGGDSGAAKQIFGGHAVIREVSENASPSIGEVWFISDQETNRLKFWKANYDSSD